jgi:hypothetical protein
MNEMQKPSLGRIVLFKISGEPINGQEEHAAIITQVWSDTGPMAINLTAFPGSGPPINGSSIQHESLTDPKMVGARSWRWPPRV